MHKLKKKAARTTILATMLNFRPRVSAKIPVGTSRIVSRRIPALKIDATHLTGVNHPNLVSPSELVKSYRITGPKVNKNRPRVAPSFL